MSAYYHVTTEKGFEKIFREGGLRSADGVCGAGVYLWDQLDLAIEYAEDIGLKDPVILKIADPAPISCAESEAGLPKSEGDSAFYEHVFLVPFRKPGKLWAPEKLSRVRFRG